MITKITHSLHGRLSLALFASFIVIVIVSSCIFVELSNKHQQEIVQELHRDLAKHVVKEYLFFEKNKINQESASQLFHQLMVLGPNFEFYIVDKDGKLLTYSADPADIKRQVVSTQNIHKFVHTKNKRTLILADDPRSLHKKKVFSAAEIRGEDGSLQGYLYIILASQIYDRTVAAVLKSKNLQLGLLLTTAALLFSLTLIIFITGIITRPLRHLTRQIQAVKSTGFKRQVSTEEIPLLEFSQKNYRADNEIDILGKAFNELLTKLNEQYKNVVTVDSLRKELISHVSHDLRTPLASLLGYLETWQLNRETQTVEQSDQYIATAQRNAEKISILIEQLFELAHLDSGDIKVKFESFSIAELVQDVLQKFKIIANAKGIILSVTPQDSSITAVGDIEKLERVFTNLIENALRHTRDGGRITVRLTRENRTVSIEVNDTGIGIPSNDIAHVFDPHFKAQNSVRGDTAHGGLGLAITKKLLNLHHSVINVRSVENEGTTFRFQLKSD